MNYYAVLGTGKPPEPETKPEKKKEESKGTETLESKRTDKGKQIKK
jgi:hypothetical protein